MKKSFRKSKVFIVALILMLSLTACGGDKKGSTENTNTAVESGKKEAKSGTLKPGDEVPDGDNITPSANKQFFGGAEVGDSGTDDTKSQK